MEIFDPYTWILCHAIPEATALEARTCSFSIACKGLARTAICIAILAASQSSRPDCADRCSGVVPATDANLPHEPIPPSSQGQRTTSWLTLVPAQIKTNASLSLTGTSRWFRAVWHALRFAPLGSPRPNGQIGLLTVTCERMGSAQRASLACLKHAHLPMRLIGLRFHMQTSLPPDRISVKRPLGPAWLHCPAMPMPPRDAISRPNSCRSPPHRN